MHSQVLLSAAPSLLSDSLAVVEERMGKYEWRAAAQLCAQVLEKLNSSKDPLRAAGITERQAKCYFKAAFQSDARNEFKQRMSLSEDSYRKAASLYEKAGSSAKAKETASRAEYATFWLQDTSTEKRAIVQKCLQIAQEAAHTFEIQGDKKQLAETLLYLMAYRKEGLYLSEGRNELLGHFEACVETAWRVIEDFSAVADDQTMLECIHTLVELYLCADYVLEQPRYEDLERRISHLKNRITQLSEKINRPESSALASESSGILAADLDGDVSKAFSFFEEGVRKSRETRDCYTIGRLHTSGSSWARWTALGEEYVEKRREQLERARDMASDAIKNLEASSSGAWLKRAYGRCAEGFTNLALEVETDLDRKKVLLDKAIQIARRGISYEKDSFQTGVGHELSKALYFRATLDVGPEEKGRLLNEALPIRQEVVRTYELLTPHYAWGLGVMLNYMALLKAELSSLEKDTSSKAELLVSAASDMQKCVKQCATITGVGPVPAGRIYTLAEYNEWSGDVFQKLYATTRDKVAPRQAIAAYADAISYLSKSASLGHIPAVRWKIAETYDSKGDYKLSSESFLQAADEYRIASKKIPGLAPTFEEFARYMEAWASIEDARLNHERELYPPAAEAYTKAASLLRSSKSWGHLSKHYSGCSLLELGEALSRQERQHASIESFNASQGTLREAVEDLEQRLQTTTASQERHELKEWAVISRTRMKYGLGRAQLEEAKLLDSRGEEEESSRKYHTASETFQSLLSETEDEATRGELETMRLSCDAWATLKLAELRASPELYSKASETFERVEKATASVRMRRLALANASMCKALEFGSSFRRTRDKQLYPEIKTRLETAGDFYEEAGVKKAADWTRATQRFFDALIYLGEASAETDTRKKADLYHLAERHLRLAANLYGDAGYLKKKEEALAQVERAQQEKELLLMPVEVLAESPAVGEVGVAPISLTIERPVGLERLESARVVGKMKASPKEVHAGMDLAIELEMANVGKATATLVRVENIVPNGFQPVKDETPFLFEKNNLNMRGKRLEYLKTLQLKIMLKPRRKGTYELKPRIVFVDQKGTEGVYEFEPATVSVKELGVLGWLKGPG